MHYHDFDIGSRFVFLSQNSHEMLALHGALSKVNVHNYDLRNKRKKRKLAL